MTLLKIVLLVLIFPGITLSDPLYARLEGLYLPGKTVAGRSYYRTGYDGAVGEIQADVEYIAGNIPVIISVPHGGSLSPEEIPDRSGGRVTTDAYTVELAYLIRDYFLSKTGNSPHISLCRLKRTKLDLNRDSEKDWASGARVLKAWEDFHFFLDEAKQIAINQSGLGFYIDLHGQPGNQTMIGYGLTGNQLRKSSEIIETLAVQSSVRALSEKHEPGDFSFVSLITGALSFGTLLERVCKSLDVSYSACVPSENAPSPGLVYYGGDYNLKRHTGLYTSDDEEYMTDDKKERFQRFPEISGVQLECNFNARNNHRENLALAITHTVIKYFSLNYSLVISQCPETPLEKIEQPDLQFE